jgi:hypothetical protein
MPVAQSPAHDINSSKGCPSITESFPLGFFCTVRHRRGIASGATPLVPAKHNFDTFCNNGHHSSLHIAQGPNFCVLVVHQ